jgi:glycosyltransferase involved in cell wall biosynthesis
VEIVPTTIDTESYRMVARAPNRRPVIGWTGSTTTVPYLARIAPALQRLRAECDFELLVIGADLQIDGIDVRCLPWEAATEPDDIRRMDVGLMPLTDDVWSRGKCALKALQYMALGIPAVVSPVGVNAQVVSHGINGFHARTDEDWVHYAKLLLGSRDLQRRMGEAARATIEQGYSARVHAPRLAALLRQVHGEASARA